MLKTGRRITAKASERPAVDRAVGFQLSAHSLGRSGYLPSERFPAETLRHCRIDPVSITSGGRHEGQVELCDLVSIAAPRNKQICQLIKSIGCNQGTFPCLP